MASIKFNNVSKIYEGKTTVIENLNLEIRGISARVGDKMSYEVERGALGFDVVKFTNSRDKDR